MTALTFITKRRHCTEYEDLHLGPRKLGLNMLEIAHVCSSIIHIFVQWLEKVWSLKWGYILLPEDITGM